MRPFLPLSLLLMTCACQTFGGRKTVSSWAALENAESVDCDSWPLRPKDLQINDLTFVHGRNKGFLASGLKRDASPMHAFAAFDDSTAVDGSDLKDLDFGRGAVVVGGASAFGRTYAIVVLNLAGGKSTIELRATPSNIVAYKGNFAAVNVIEGTTVRSQGGAWVVFKSDENEFRVAFIDLRKKDHFQAKVVPGLVFKERPQILAMAGRPGAVAVYKEGDIGRPFKTVTLSEAATAGPPVPLDISVAIQVESWSAVAVPGGDYLAFVDGDSLVGQADLRISHFNWTDSGVAVRWTKRAPLHDVHATRPVFIASRRGLEVLLLNWIDEESTIARYMVAGGNIGKPAFSGIFPKGSRIVDAFTGKSLDDIYVITRHRDDTRWAFQICEI